MDVSKWFNSSFVLNCLPFINTFLVSKPHKFSIGFKSGENDNLDFSALKPAMICFCTLTRRIILLENPFILSKWFRNVIYMIVLEILITYGIHATFDERDFWFVLPAKRRPYHETSATCLSLRKYLRFFAQIVPKIRKTVRPVVIKFFFDLSRSLSATQISKPYALEKIRVFSLCVLVITQDSTSFFEK